MNVITTKTYSELIELKTFVDRFNYLKLDGEVGIETFGFDRYLNQALYNSQHWDRARRKVIIRDNGCNLGIIGREIYKGIIIHHMNPITKDDIIRRDPKIFNPEFLITTNLRTHNAIHYSDESILQDVLIERTKNDTIPWR